MSGAPSERQKLSGGVLPRDGSVKCLVPRQTASPQERLLRPWAEFLLVAPPAEQQERTPLERQRRWPAQEVSKNITSRQMGSRKLRHRASSDKSVAPLGHDTGTLRERERLGDGADNTRDATLGWLKSGTGVPGPSRRGLRRRKPSSDTQAPPPLGECQKLSVSPVSDHQRQAMSVMPAVRQDSDEESRPEKPLLMDASRKWSSLQPPMWAAGRTITSTEKPTGAKTNRCDKNVGPGETKQQRFPNQ